MTTLGFDLSLNHSGAVALDDNGDVENIWFVSDTKRAADQGAGRGVRSLVKPKGMDAENHQLRRMLFYRKWFRDVTKESGAEYAGIEGYAFAAVSNSSYQYGELGGLARMTLARYSVKIRIHDTQSVKIFGAKKGNANAADLFMVLPEAYRTEWSRIDRGLKIPQVAEDLAVAYTVARLVHAEIELRAGRVLLSDLPEHRRRVFNRITKTHPVNLLDREWISA